MKTKTKSSKTKSNELDNIHLEFIDPSAHRVFVAGSFNDWQPDVGSMIDLGHDRWGKELSLAPGR